MPQFTLRRPAHSAARGNEDRHQEPCRVRRIIGTRSRAPEFLKSPRRPRPGDSRNLNSEVGPESKREFRPLHSSGLNKTAAGPGYEERYLPLTLCLVLVVTRKSILLTGSER
jgi:hypothetical protein